MNPMSRIALAGALTLAVFASRGRAEEPPPEEAAAHGQVARYQIGTGPRSYWLFEPADPRPENAPVVVFLHGWFSVNPAFYGAWIDHLVRDGKTVVFPRYQNDVGTLPRDFLPNALHAVRDALGVLRSGRGHVRPAAGKFALIGHSAGGNLAAQLAALSADPGVGLPEVKAVTAFFPGEVLPSREPSFDRIPATTLLVVAVGQDDVVVGDRHGRRIFAEATSVPRERKRFLFYRTDRHGHPALVADHMAPTGANARLDDGEGVLRALQLGLGSVDALDRAGFWRVADATLAAGFAGGNLDEAAADAEAFVNLGYWSDGRKVAAPVLTDELDSAPRVILSNGIRVIPWDLDLRSVFDVGSSAVAR